jgi:hypothetical protein
MDKRKKGERKKKRERKKRGKRKEKRSATCSNVRITWCVHSSKNFTVKSLWLEVSESS